MTPSNAPAASGPTRRDVLRYLAYGTAGAAIGAPLIGCSTSERNTAGGPGERQRVLVVLELAGGNDSWSTIVPHENGTYHDLRPTLALSGEQVIDWGGGWGINAKLADLNRLGVAALGGVGIAEPDLSHFAMLDRWWQGIPSGPVKAVGNTGFLGRICDELSTGDRFTGISLQNGAAPALNSESAPTASIDDIAQVMLDHDPVVADLFGRSLAKLRAAPGSPFEQAVGGLHRITWITDVIQNLAEPSTGYPDTTMGTRLAAASRLIRSNTGARVVHVPMATIEFDTHQDHGPIHQQLMQEMNDSVSAFLEDLERSGYGDDVLVATTSEFGRRADEHDGGLDHGAASTMLMFGPVVPGMHGEQSPIDRLDDNSNLISTVSFDRYLATLATWLEVDPAKVLGGSGSAAPEPIGGLIAT